MKRKLLIMFTVLLLMASLATPFAFAKKDDNNGKAKGHVNKEANKPTDKGSPVEHLLLYEKDPVTWEPVEDGAWAKLTILTHKDKYIFNGHELDAGLDYSLLYYNDPWPGEYSQVLGEGTVNEEGNVHIMGEFDFSSIPTEGDENYPDAKLWLVPSDDIGSFEPIEPVEDEPDYYKMVGWSPELILFENNLLNFR